jgi:hypothetical protein
VPERLRSRRPTWQIGCAPSASETTSGDLMGDASRSAKGVGGGQRYAGTFHQIPCKFNGKWVGMLWNREAKG